MVDQYLVNELVSIDGSRTAATSKMERFVIIINGLQPLTIITKHSILNVAAVVDPPLSKVNEKTNLDHCYLILYLIL